MAFTIPRASLVLLVGPSGSGKSTFARRHFLPTEIVSSDACRALVSDDESARDADHEAFGLLHHIVAARLRMGRLSVVDATNLADETRHGFVALARGRDAPVIAVVFDIALAVLEQGSAGRTERRVSPDVVREQRMQLDQVLARLHQEGFSQLHVVRGGEEPASLRVERGLPRAQAGGNGSPRAGWSPPGQ